MKLLGRCFIRVWVEGPTPGQGFEFACFAFNQGILFRSRPAFDLTFPSVRLFQVGNLLLIDKRHREVFPRMVRAFTPLVCLDSRLQVLGNADVVGTIAAAEDVDVHRSLVYG